MGKENDIPYNILNQTFKLHLYTKEKIIENLNRILSSGGDILVQISV